MNFFAPERSRINGSPCYAEFSAVLPHILISPGEEYFVDAVAFVPSERGFSQRYASFSTTELITFIQEYKDDPEAALCKHFGWSGELPRQRTTLTLEDLGL